MFKIALASLGDGGTDSVLGLTLQPAALELGALFQAPVLVDYELNHTFGKVYAKVKAGTSVQ